jgi:hypothetical protein
LFDFQGQRRDFVVKFTRVLDKGPIFYCAAGSQKIIKNVRNLKIILRSERTTKMIVKRSLITSYLSVQTKTQRFYGISL